MGNKGILLIFLDGVGIGSSDPAVNPFAGRSDASRLDGFEAISGARDWSSLGFTELRERQLVRHGIDACLGVDGLPQSGTGQATLFTGVNCAALAGRHYGPYPHSATRLTIVDQNIFAQAKRAGCTVAFANAYPPIFFDYAARTDRWPVTTRCCLDADVPIRRSSDIARGRAVPADLTGRLLVRRDPEVEPFDESRSAAILTGIARRHNFTLLEYFLTDKAGHSMETDRADATLASLSRFFAALAVSLDRDETTLVVTSDHGNVEDLTTKSHTRNPVPLVACGWAAPWFAEATDLTSVTPAILAALGRNGAAFRQ